MDRSGERPAARSDGSVRSGSGNSRTPPASSRIALTGAVEVTPALYEARRRLHHPALALPGDSAPGCHLGGGGDVRVGTPLLRLHNARIYQVKPVEEARYRGAVAHGRLGAAHPLVHALGHLGHVGRADVAG